MIHGYLFCRWYSSSERANCFTSLQNTLNNVITSRILNFAVVHAVRVCNWHKMDNMVTTSNCYFYSQLVYGKGHWASWFLLLSYGVEARSIYFIKATMRTDYRYAVQLNRSTTLVSTAFAFAIVLKYKHNFCTLSLLTRVQLKESFTEFTAMLLF